MAKTPKATTTAESADLTVTITGAVLHDGEELGQGDTLTLPARAARALIAAGAAVAAGAAADA